MKIRLNEKALRIHMAEKGIYTFRELCEKSGAVYSAVMNSRSRLGTLSAEAYWLIANYLDCHIEDLQITEWAE